METAWTDAVCLLGGNRQVAAAAAADLIARYAEPHRRYHDTTHVRTVLRDAAVLAEELSLTPVERAILTVAAAAHDVVYDARPGDDERRSASWARDWLSRAGVEEGHVARVEGLVLATMSLSAAPDDLTAWALLDADLAILGADPQAYDRYRLAVREEYAAFDEAAWRAGRAAVMSGLLARGPLYRTAAAGRRWEATARANIARELDSVTTAAPEPPMSGTMRQVTDRAPVVRWLAGYEAAWRTPGTEALAELFTGDATYLQSPYEVPVTGLDAIGRMWEEEREGPDEVFTLATDILAVDGLTAVVRAEVQYGDPPHQEYRDLWVIRFAGDGRCARFEEWPFWPGSTYSANPG